MIQDIAPKRFMNAWKKDKSVTDESIVLQFAGRKLLCKMDGDVLTLPTRELFADGDARFRYLFAIDEQEYFLLLDDDERKMDGWEYRDINLFRTAQPRETAFAAVNAWHLCSWYRDSRYCGRCGAPAVHDENERMMHCLNCGNMMFPRIMPSVIVGVINGESLLLTRYNRPGAQRTALIAGFTEFGETGEETVAREVYEEVGLKVKNIRYYKTQPWGISAGGLLMGYWCEVDGDDTIRIDGTELAEGAWVSREELKAEFHDPGIALTGEMIHMFSEGKEK